MLEAAVGTAGGVGWVSVLDSWGLGKLVSEVAADGLIVGYSSCVGCSGAGAVCEVVTLDHCG
jgi:hypothetical protein